MDAQPGCTDALHDHGYVLTTEGRFFALAGERHSPASVFGMLYYVQTNELQALVGKAVDEKFQFEGKAYSKLLSAVSYARYPAFIERHFPSHFYSPPTWRSLMRLERADIRRGFDPRDHVGRTPPGPLGERVSLLLDVLGLAAPTLRDRLGIAGSLLLGSHGPRADAADVDLLVYGRENVSAVHELLAREDARRALGLTAPGPAVMDGYVRSRMARFPGTYEQLYRLTLRRWDVAMLGDTRVDFCFVDDLPQNRVDYDAPVLGARSLCTVVEDASEGAFLPTVLRVVDAEIGYVMITARAYSCLFAPGDRIRARGTVHLDTAGRSVLVVDDLNAGSVVLADE